MHSRKRLAIVALFTALPAARPAAAGPAPDKSAYTLFNPTPRDKMREFNTDRPGTTESPYTVDAGHFQAELGLLDFTRDVDADGVKTGRLAAGEANLKVGLLDDVDLQFVFDSYVDRRVKFAGRNDRRAGFGDATVRLKVNVLGNDGGGPVALAVMPYVTLPTATAHDLGAERVEGGLILPASIDLPGGFELGAMVEVDVRRDADNDGYGAEYVHSVTLAHDLWGDFRGYVEYAGVAPRATDSTYRATFGTGLTYKLNDDAQLDAGVNLGLSDRADDFDVFVGLSFRI